jgi:hypothetical protein
LLLPQKRLCPCIVSHLSDQLEEGLIGGTLRVEKDRNTFFDDLREIAGFYQPKIAQPPGCLGWAIIAGLGANQDKLFYAIRLLPKHLECNEPAHGMRKQDELLRCVSQDGSRDRFHVVVSGVIGNRCLDLALELRNQWCPKVHGKKLTGDKHRLLAPHVPGNGWPFRQQWLAHRLINHIQRAGA